MNDEIKKKFYKRARRDGTLNAYHWLFDQGMVLDSADYVAYKIVERFADHYGWTEIASKLQLGLPSALKDEVEQNLGN